MIIKKCYANGINSTYYSNRKKNYKHILSKEEQKKKNKKDALNQKKNRARELFNSNTDSFEYFFTITSGLIEERRNPYLLKKEVIKYLKQQNIKNYCIVVQKNNHKTDFLGDICINSSDPDEYHVHGICHEHLSLSEWIEKHSCSIQALYIDEIRDIDKAINYMVRDLGNLPEKFHGCSASYKRKKSKTEIKKNARNVKNNPYTNRYDIKSMKKRFKQGGKFSRADIQHLFDYIDQILILEGAQNDK